MGGVQYVQWHQDSLKTCMFATDFAWRICLLIELFIIHVCSIHQSWNLFSFSLSLSPYFPLMPCPWQICFVQEDAAPPEDEDEWDEEGRVDLEEGEQVQGSNNHDDPKHDEAAEDQLDEEQGNVYKPETAIVEPNLHDHEVAAKVGKDDLHSQGHGSDPGHQHQVGTEDKTQPDQPAKEKVEEEKQVVDKPGVSSVLVALHRF